jgi:hypothetical protein
MTEPTYSFVYDRTKADTAFPGISASDLVLSLLARFTPELEWESCLVFEGESPFEEGTVCIGTSGPGADALQLRLLDAFERHSVCAIEVFEGGPEARLLIARVENGQWVRPS